MNGSTSSWFFTLAFALSCLTIVSGHQRQRSRCIEKWQGRACLFIKKIELNADEAIVGNSCSQTPECGCLYHGVCDDQGTDNKTIVFLCKNKKTGELCESNLKEFESGKKRRRVSPKIRRRREAEQEESESVDSKMINIPPVMRKIINRHRNGNPQSFGMGTFFLSEFANTNGTRKAHEVKMVYSNRATKPTQDNEDRPSDDKKQDEQEK